jgi:GTPase SAR1 family protein
MLALWHAFLQRMSSWTSNNATVSQDEIKAEYVLIPEPSGFGHKQFGLAKYSEIQKLTKNEPQNILLLGPFGSGKSSFLNTLLTATGSRREARVSGNRDHGTVSLEKYEVPQTNVKVWDCWGFSKKNFDSVVLNEMLDGHFLSGKDMNSGINPKSPNFKRIPANTDKMNNAIFLAAATDLTNNPDLQEKFKEFLDLLFRKGYNPVLALTKIDLIDKNLALAPQKVYASPLANQEIFKAANISGLNPNKIFPVKNYNFEFDRNPLLENGHLHCLYAACKSAQKFDDDRDVVMGETTVQPEQGLRDFLKGYGLEAFAAALEELGVVKFTDIGFLEDKEVASAKLKPVQAKKILALREKFSKKSSK